MQMGEPFGKTPISGVLSCWFDDQPEEETPQTTTPTLVAVPTAVAVVEPKAPAPASEQASSSLLDLMEAIHDRHMLPGLFVPEGGRHEAPLMRPESEPKLPVQSGYRPSFQDLVSRIYQSTESRSYQWLMQHGLAVEFDERAISLEQRWNTDGSYCAVRRTANGYTHTVMLKADGSCSGERIAGPNGPIAQFTSSGAVLPTEEANRFARLAARQTA